MDASGQRIGCRMLALLLLDFGRASSALVVQIMCPISINVSGGDAGRRG